jgi:hypothetical protein
MNTDSLIAEIVAGAERLESTGPAMVKVLRKSRKPVHAAFLNEWPTRGDPDHPEATGESLSMMVSDEVPGGFMVGNTARHAEFLTADNGEPLMERIGNDAMIRETDDIVDGVTSIVLNTLAPKGGR